MKKKICTIKYNNEAQSNITKTYTNLYVLIAVEFFTPSIWSRVLLCLTVAQ